VLDHHKIQINLHNLFSKISSYNHNIFFEENSTMLLNINSFEFDILLLRRYTRALASISKTDLKERWMPKEKNLCGNK
jgi:hypothetical protein